jgi:hypothetical protein
MIEIRFNKTKDEVALLIWFLVDHSVLSIMLSNIIILLLILCLHCLSHMPLIRGSSIECESIWTRLRVLFFLPSQFHSFSSLFLFLLLNTIIFFSTFTSSFFFLKHFPRFFNISFISLSLLPIIKSSANYRLQIFSLATTLHLLVLDLTFHPYLPHIL